MESHRQSCFQTLGLRQWVLRHKHAAPAAVAVMVIGKTLTPGSVERLYNAIINTLNIDLHNISFIDISENQTHATIMQQMTSIQPRLLLALGDDAAQTLLNSTTPLILLRTSTQQYNNIPLIVTHHPADLLNNPDDKKHVYANLRRAKQLLKKMDD